MPDDAAPLVVLLPVYDDWPAVSRLVPLIAAELAASGPVGILIVDDGSILEAIDLPVPYGLAWVRILRLRRNVGHQRALAIGLSYIDEHVDCHAVVVMDADGEDRPSDLVHLLKRYGRSPDSPIVFAERRRRVEGIGFRVFYLLYRWLHWALTGRTIRIGNFSVLPRKRLASLVVVSELWIHYAAAAVRSRQPICTVPTERGLRLDGVSRMNFVALVIHGLSAISVYSDVVFTRLVTLTGCLALVSMIGMVTVIGIRTFTTLAIPGWASYVLGILLLLVLQAVMFAASLMFIVLGSRQQVPVIPRRDYREFVADVREMAAVTPAP
jgi:glycosyltransferase involved in cell wall biosynthesis